MLEDYLAKARSNDLLRNATQASEPRTRRTARPLEDVLNELYDGAAGDRRYVDPALFDRFCWAGLHLS